jgi:hypothetical protein
MAETTHSDPAGTDRSGAKTTNPERTPVTKVTRARATTSDVPARPTPPAKPPAHAANVEINQVGADSVAGDSVGISQGGASVVTAGSVTVHQGGIANAQADDITVSMGGVALARADRVSVEMGGIGIAFAREAHLTQGVARTILAQDVRVDQGLIGTTFAGRVTFERPSGVFLLLAGRTEGPVRAMLDWRGALAFGAAFGVLVGLFRRR